MQFKLTALMDDETRKALREMLIGEAKGAARSEAQSLFQSEIKAAVKRQMDAFQSNNWISRGIIQDALTSLLKTQWGEIAQMLQKALDAAIQAKLADKTVWEAEKQNDHIRALARDEIRKMLSGLK